MFATAERSILIFVNKATTYKSALDFLFTPPPKGCPTNIRLTSRCLKVQNALAYHKSGPHIQGDQKIGRKFVQNLCKVAQTVAKPKLATICS